MRVQFPRAACLCAAFVTALALAAVPAFADEPTKPEAEKSEAAKPADGPVRARGGLTEADVARAFGQYRKQVRKGETLYCRSEKTIGTNIRKQVCYSEEQVIQNARNERDARDQLRNTNVCGAGSCSPGGG